MHLTLGRKCNSYYGQHYTDFAGTHSRMGMLLAAGPQIRPGSRLEPVKITDVAPTALHLMGIPIPRDMDGSVLTALLLRFGIEL